TSGAIHVFDVTAANAVQELQAQVTQQKTGFTVQVTPALDGQRILLALTDASAKTTDARSLNQPSNWHSAANGADLVIIANKAFIGGIEPLRALRQSQGLNVAVVDGEDVYDEFSYGQKTPQAIRDF